MQSSGAKTQSSQDMFGSEPLQVSSLTDDLPFFLIKNFHALEEKKELRGYTTI